jgi:opacity protein-like surface antigen
MKTCLVAPLFLLTLGSAASAQAPQPITPSAPNFGFSLPTTEGTLTYALSGTESFLTGQGESGLDHTTVLSGDLAYLSTSVNKPFSIVYSGGYLLTSTPGTPESTTFQNLALSQVITTKNWNFVIDDGVSYLPQSPTTGLSGIPGVGDIGVTPVTIGDQPSQSILTNYESRVGNGLNGGATRQINASTSVNASGSWQILRFLGNSGIDSSSESASVGTTHRIDARSTASATVNYAYTADQYLGANLPFTSEGISFQYTRQLSHFFNVTASAGPQRTYGSGVAAPLIPSRIYVVAGAGLNYTRRFTTASLGYSRATNSGSGVVYGALTDSVVLSASQQLSRNWQVAANASYARSSSLAKIAGIPTLTTGIYGGAQVSRKLSRSLFAYFSYTTITQSVDETAGTQNTFNGLNQVFAVGLTYSPGALHLGHF